MSLNEFKDEGNANFKVDVNQYLGVKYGLYCDALRGLSLSSPSVFFNYRRDVMTYLKTQAVSNIYSTLFYAMRDGLTPKGDEMVKLPCGSPNISQQIINEKCLSIAKTLDSLIQECVDLICPIYMNSAALSRTEIQGAAAGIK